MPIHGPDTPLWSSYKCSSTPSILSTEEDVIYPWEIDVAIDHMLDFQERRMAKIKLTARLRSPDKLLAEGTFEDNPHSSSSSHKSSVEVKVEFTSSSSSSEGETSSSSRVILKKRSRAKEEPA